MSFQYYSLGQQVKKMEDWRKAHRRGRRPRGPSDKVRDVGEIVGRRDDGVADPNEQYEKDSFIASDSEEVEEDLAEDASTSEASTSHRKPGSENSVEGWEKQSHTANVRPFSAVLLPFHMFAIVSKSASESTYSESEEEAESSDGDDSESWLSVDSDEFDDDAEYHVDSDSEASALLKALSHALITREIIDFGQLI